MNCSERLKHETSQAHLYTEKLLLKKLQAIHSVDDYQHILKIFYGFFKPVEGAISNYLNSTILPDYHLRGFADRIMHDLLALGDQVPTAISAVLPHVDNVREACGAMYVMEGSTLGGQVIARILREKENIAIADESLTFFRGHGDRTVPMCRTFQAFLNDTFKTETQLEEVTGSATETFEKLGDWINRN